MLEDVTNYIESNPDIIINEMKKINNLISNKKIKRKNLYGQKHKERLC